MKKKSFSIVSYGFAYIWLAVTIFPLVITFLCSFKDNEGITLNMFSLPTVLHFENYTAAVERALEEYRLWQRSQPGRDINPTRLISLLEQAGAKRVELESPRYQKLEQRQIARETSLDLQFMGIEDD